MTQVMETHWKEALMSQAHDTLTDQLRQRLREIKEGKQGQDWLRGLLEWLLQELLEVEFAEFLGAEPYERSEARRGYRNGYRERGLITRVGRLTLRVLRDRQGRFSSELFERYQRSEKALVLALQESYLQGVSLAAHQDRRPARCAALRSSCAG